MPPSTIVLQTTPEALQGQYGTLWAAVERYLDGRMPEQQRAALELVVDAAFIGAVASTRLLRALTERD